MESLKRLDTFTSLKSKASTQECRKIHRETTVPEKKDSDTGVFP